MMVGKKRNGDSGPAGSRQRHRTESGNGPPGLPPEQPELPPRYLEACRLAGQGQYDDARRLYAQLARRASKNNRLSALIQNDLAVIEAVEGKFDQARERWRAAIETDGQLLLARLNRDFIEAEIHLAEVQEKVGELKLVPAPGSSPTPAHGRPLAREMSQAVYPPETRASDTAVRPTSALPDSGRGGPINPMRVAILSFLFNWPSTGGGNMHTAGLVEFLWR
jgi:hypothetical protein